jgi:hypothetical protein
MARNATPRVVGRGICLKCFVANDFQFLTPDGKRPRGCVIHDPGALRRPVMKAPPSDGHDADSALSEAARLPNPSEIATVTTAQVGGKRGRAPTAEELGSRRIETFFASGEGGGKAVRRTHTGSPQ